MVIVILLFGHGERWVDDQSQQLDVSRPAKSRDFIVIVIVAVLIIGAFLLITFNLIDQSDTHVRNVEKVKMAEHFAYDEIGTDEAEQTVTAFLHRENGRRKKGDFSTLNFTDEHLQRVSIVRELEELDIGHTKVTDKGLEYLAGMPLRELDVSADAVTDQGLDSILKIRTLSKLVITETPITDEGIAKLIKLRKLNSLIAAGTKLTNKGVAHLVSAPRLQRLDITSTLVTNECLQDISRMPKLNVLLADSTQITGAGICRFLRAPKLFKVSLAGCKIYDSDIPCLQEAMPGVKSLDFSTTQITDQGLANLAKWKSLGVLKVRYLEFSEDAKSRFQAELPTCKIYFETR